MKKIFTSILFAFALTSFSFGQYYVLPFINAGENPGGLNTEEDQTAAYMLGNYTGYTQIINPGASQWSAMQTVPFTFDFNGTSVSSFYVSSNGVVTFSTPGAVPSDVNVAIPDASIPDNSILVWGLNCTGANDGVTIKTFGTAPNRQLWVTWASASWNGMNVGISAWAYWSIVIEETSNNIYIVDARNYAQAGAGPALTAGLQFDANSALSLAGSPAFASVNSLASGGSDVGPADNTYYAFIQGTQPQYDFDGKSVDMDKYLKIGDAPFAIKGTVTNLGSETITSFDANYKINGGTAVIQSISGVSIAPLAEYQFTTSANWTPSVTGPYDIEIYASNLNGNADQSTANDMAMGNVIVVDQTTDRYPLYEVFTSSTCAPCLAGNQNFHSVVAGKEGEFVEIKYQQNFPGTGDPYCTAEALNRRNYYAVNSIPRMEIDGGWDQNASSFTGGIHTDSRNVPAFLVLNSTHKIDVPNQTVTVDVDYEALADFPSAQNVLHVAIVEKKTTKNIKTNGETEFLYVMKKMLPNDNGTTLGAIANGATDSKNLSFTFAGDYRLPADGQAASYINDATEHSVEEFNDLTVVAWVQDNATKEVLNSVNSELSEFVSVNETSVDAKGLKLYPNPTNGNLFVELNAEVAGVTNIKVIDPIGKLVKAQSFNTTSGAQQLQLDLEGTPAGMYFLTVEENGNISTKKFFVSK
jgi:hypothetical protein